MTNNLTNQSIHKTSLVKCLLVGAGIALVPITLFLLGVKDADPAWGKFWMAKPLIIVPLAGAAGGVFYYLMDKLRCHGGWKRAAANVVSLLVFIIGLWLGSVIGLNGTLWD